jgi:hypothetical protein
MPPKFFLIALYSRSFEANLLKFAIQEQAGARAFKTMADNHYGQGRRSESRKDLCDL